MKGKAKKRASCWPWPKGRKAGEKENFYAPLSLANTTFAFYVLVLCRRRCRVVSYQWVHVYEYIYISIYISLSVHSVCVCVLMAFCVTFIVI